MMRRLIVALAACLYISLEAQVVLSLSLDKPPTNISRRHWLQQGIVTATAAGILSGSIASPALAAPPIAIIAEELGYFPVKNKAGDVVYIPKKIQRESTAQAVELAKEMQQKGITMYGAFWCPHCARQKEIFGKEAWSYINYVECASKGYGYKGICKDVDGYPEFKDKRGKFNVDGERPLEVFAKELGFVSFDPSLEDEVPMSGTSCKLR
jgi:glutaredoxin-related protein